MIGVYNGTSVLDVHSHLRASTPSAMYLLRLLAGNTASASPLRPGAPPPSGPMSEGLGEEEFVKAAERHARYLDERNIDVQILGPHPVDVNGWMDPHVFMSWTSFVNDMIFRVCQARPDRWVGACQLPQLATEPDISHVLPELERCVSEYAFVATYVSPDITGRRDTPGMHERYWYPLYERCQELDLPIIVHGTDGKDPRFRVVPQNYQLAFLSEQYFSTMFLRHSNVFDDFPQLRILVCHCGGALDRFIKESPLVGRQGRDISNNLYFDTCAYDLDYLAAAIKQRGVSQMCFGVEAP